MQQNVKKTEATGYEMGQAQNDESCPGRRKKITSKVVRSDGPRGDHQRKRDDCNRSFNGASPATRTTATLLLRENEENIHRREGKKASTQTDTARGGSSHA